MLPRIVVVRIRRSKLVKLSSALPSGETAAIQMKTKTAVFPSDRPRTRMTMTMTMVVTTTETTTVMTAMKMTLSADDVDNGEDIDLYHRTAEREFRHLPLLSLTSIATLTLLVHLLNPTFGFFFPGYDKPNHCS